MAIYHLKAATGSLATTDKKGNPRKPDSARAKCQYILREGQYDEPHRDKKIAEGHGNMPQFANNPRAYWEAADQYERNNGRLYKEVEFALPRELSLDQQRELVFEFAEELTKAENLPYHFAIHEGKGSNPHCHLLISERINDGLDRPAEQWFKRANKKNPEKGGAVKTENLKSQEWLENNRARWAEVANQALEQAGFTPDLDHRSKKEQFEEAEQDLEKAISSNDLEAFEFAKERALKAAGPAQAHVGPGQDQDNISLTYADRRRQQEQINQEIRQRAEEIRAELNARYEADRQKIVEFYQQKQREAVLEIEPIDKKQAFKGDLLTEQYKEISVNMNQLLYINQQENTVKLKDGSEVTDFGASLTADKVTKSSAELMAEMAKAKNWKQVNISGADEKERLQMARELTLRGIEVSNQDAAIRAAIEKTKAKMAAEYQAQSQKKEPAQTPAAPIPQPVTAMTKAEAKQAFEESCAKVSELDKQIEAETRTIAANQFKNFDHYRDAAMREGGYIEARKAVESAQDRIDQWQRAHDLLSQQIDSTPLTSRLFGESKKAYQDKTDKRDQLAEKLEQAPPRLRKLEKKRDDYREDRAQSLYTEGEARRKQAEKEAEERRKKLEEERRRELERQQQLQKQAVLEEQQKQQKKDKGWTPSIHSPRM